MRRYLLSSLSALLLLLVASTGFAQGIVVQNPSAAPKISLDAALASVRWQGRVPSAASLGDKTPVVLVYASWCPKCNVWSPEMFAQINKAIQDKPVVLFAINADENTRGVNYALERNLIGPNIFHGDDPTIVQRMGFESELFYYSMFEDGMQTNRMQAGAYYKRPDGTQHYAIAREIEADKKGTFSVIKPDQSAGLKQILWPAELGGKLDERSLLSMRKNLDESLTNEFNSAIVDYLNNQIEKIKLSRSGTVPEQIAGYEQASKLANDFKSTSQGKACRELVEKLDEDKAFQDEVLAKNLYDQGRARAKSAVDLRRQMGRIVSRYPDSYYGQEAQKAIAATQ
ncbi:hypothetical protein LOC68_15450 [Blastopirellula sp. JC732]|uniref:Thioredoxin domain-containing protein n=1 Tax=Blastopirellula sediminis TaxID=2894196 RepID=A0A9X1MN91_9BACT|nr:hypothetical protein [Blastopirellula sediminis]MCC9606921.1 hypothetical protein [Blastopirellula sediminis]MCC9629784.1 hypothetical protein [Blastopirellula sediminis]